MRSRWLGAFIALVLAASACTDEATSPIDLNATTTTSPPVTGLPDLPEDDPNAEVRTQLVDLAKEECRKDPTREFGVVVIADADGVEVNRFEFPCSELDGEDSGVNDSSSTGSSVVDSSGDE